MIITCSESRSITQAVDGNGIVGSAKADSTGVTGEATLCDVVRCIGTNEESIAAEDGVCSESWSLKQ